MAETSNGSGITEAEAALYDRQIRLWGLDAQTRMREACVAVRGLETAACEVLKNLVLAGIGRIVLIDEEDVEKERDASSRFLISVETSGKRWESVKEHLEVLNPLVKVEHVKNEELIEALVERKVTVLLATGCLGKEYVNLNEACRERGIKFYCLGTTTWTGWAFSDQGPEHRYVVQRANALGAAVKVVKKQVFVPLSVALKTTWAEEQNARVLKRINEEGSRGLLDVWLSWRFEEEHGRRIRKGDEEVLKVMALKLQQEVGVKSTCFHPDQLAGLCEQTTAMTPVAAILGGIVGQDILNSVGGKEEPLANWFCFDASGREYSGSTYNGLGGIWRLAIGPAQEIVE